MSTTAPTPAEPTNPATRVRDALRGVRAAYRGDSILLELRRTLGTLEVAVEAMLAADADLRDRDRGGGAVTAAIAGLDRIIAAGAGLVPDSVLARELRIVRADLELAKAALERGDVVLREREAEGRDHLIDATESRLP